MLGSRPKREVSEETFNQLPQLMGNLPQSIPDEVRESIKFAEEKMRALKLMPN